MFDRTHRSRVAAPPCTYKSQEERHKLGMNHKNLCALVAFFHRLLFQFAALRHYSCAANAIEVLR